ncbi:integrase family protein, partial [mine drainage metagenome]
FAALWRLLAVTGMRRGEACGLRWDDVDLEGGTLSIRVTRVVVGHEVVESLPKTAASARSIALDARTIQLLRSHAERQEERRRQLGPAYVDSGLVVTWEDGRPVHPSMVTKIFTREARAAGLAPIRLHDLRHSHATAGLEAGVPAKVMSERLGHSSVKTTLDIYSHVSPAIDREAAEKTAAHLFGDM